MLMLACSQPTLQGVHQHRLLQTLGVTTSDILKAADWSTESVLRRFYYRPTHDPFYGWAVLSSATKDT